MKLVQQLNRVTLGFLKCSWRLCLVQHRCFRSVRWWMGFYVLSEGAWKSFENFCDFIYEVFDRKSFSTFWCCARTCAGTDQFTRGNSGPPLTAAAWQRSTTSAWSLSLLKGDFSDRNRGSFLHGSSERKSEVRLGPARARPRCQPCRLREGPRPAENFLGVANPLRRACPLGAAVLLLQLQPLVSNSTWLQEHRAGIRCCCLGNLSFSVTCSFLMPFRT